MLCKEPGLVLWAAGGPDSSARAAATKHPGLGGFNTRHLYLTVPEAGKSKIMVLADSAPGKSPLPGL